MKMLELFETDVKDEEGRVVSFLIRKDAAAASTTAVLYIPDWNDYFFNEELADKYGTLIEIHWHSH